MAEAIRQSDRRCLVLVLAGLPGARRLTSWLRQMVCCRDIMSCQDKGV